MQELNSVFKQTESNTNYARAFTHIHAMLINNIESNSAIEENKKHQLRSSINAIIEELKQSLLPCEYKQLQNIKAKLERNENAVTGQKHRYEMLKQMNEGDTCIIYNKQLSNKLGGRDIDTVSKIISDVKEQMDDTTHAYDVSNNDLRTIGLNAGPMKKYP